jgi:hypothetical protein
VLAKCGSDGIADDNGSGSITGDARQIKPNCTFTTADIEAARNEVLQGTS